MECETNCIECNQNTSKCLKCDDEYIIQEGKCIAYSFKAVYLTSIYNIPIRLINLEKNFIVKIYIDLDDRFINATNPYTYLLLTIK